MRYKITPQQLVELPIGSFIDFDQKGDTIWRFNIVEKSEKDSEPCIKFAYKNPVTGGKLGIGLSIASLIRCSGNYNPQGFTAVEIDSLGETSDVAQEKPISEPSGLDFYHVTYNDYMMEPMNWSEELDKVPSPGIPEIK